ncbi:MAG: tRNA pseudouridine(55) synthase TruB [Pseudomonadota bacterium]
MSAARGTRRAPRQDVHGIIVLDKPEGLSSNRALQRVRGLLNARKGGHTGALDPAASGLLPLCFGEATKVSAFLLDADKTYEVAATFGERRSTGDREGDVVARGPVPALSDSGWRERLAALVGPMQQVPPMYSALKHGGRRLYELARAGESVERQPRAIVVRAIELLGAAGATVRFAVTCSKGTYVRVLVEDLATALGTVAYTSGLRRTGLGPFAAATMVPLARLEAEPDTVPAHLRNIDTALTALPAVRLTGAEARRFAHGQAVSGPAAGPGGQCRVYAPGGELLGVGLADEAGTVAPVRVIRHGEPG